MNIVRKCRLCKVLFQITEFRKASQRYCNSCRDNLIKVRKYFARVRQRMSEEKMYGDFKWNTESWICPKCGGKAEEKNHRQDSWNNEYCDIICLNCGYRKDSVCIFESDN